MKGSAPASTSEDEDAMDDHEMDAMDADDDGGAASDGETQDEVAARPFSCSKKSTSR